jgi:hypothetical protein
MVHTCNASTGESEEGGLQVPSQSRLDSNMVIIYTLQFAIRLCSQPACVISFSLHMLYRYIYLADYLKKIVNYSTVEGSNKNFKIKITATFNFGLYTILNFKNYVCIYIYYKLVLLL